jgi:hypothetical protein
VPTVADSVFFDQASTYTVTMTGALACLDITVSTGTVTFATGTTPTLTVAGNVAITAGTTTWNSTGTITLSATTSKTITSGGTTFNCSMTVSGAGGTKTLQDNLTLSSTSTFTVTSGTLALGSHTLTTGLFNSSNSNTRVLNFGTGKIVLTSATTSTIFTTGTTTGLTVSGTPLVECVTTGTGVTKTINTGAPSEANSISFSLLNTVTGTTYAFSASNVVRNLIIDGVQTVSNINLIIYGAFTHLTTNGTTTFTAGANAWTFAATSGSFTINNIAGFTYDFPWIFGNATSTATWTLANNLTLGATRQLTLRNGSFDINSKTISAAGITILTGTPTLLNTGTGSFTTTLPFTHTSGSFTLPFNITTSSASGYTFTAGTLALSTFTLTTTLFGSSGSGTRTLNFGTGQLALTGNGVTILNLATLTNFTTTGTFYVNSTYTGSVGTRTILWGSDAGSTEALAQNVSFSGTTGIVLSPSATDTIALTGGFNSINFTGFTGTLSNTGRSIFGDLTIPASGGTFTAGTNVTTFRGTGTETITTNGRTLDFPITFSGVGGTFVLAGALTLGSARTVTLDNGTLNLNDFTLTAAALSSSGSTARVIAFGTTGQITLVGNSATVLNMATITGFTYTGTPRIYSTYSGASGTRTFNIGSTAGSTSTNVFDLSFGSSGTGLVITPATDTVALSGGYLNGNFTNNTSTITNTARSFFGNLTIPATGGTFTAGSSVTNIVSGIPVDINIQRTIDFPITCNSVGGTLNFLNNLTLGSTRTFTLTAGALNLNNLTLSAATFSSSGTGVRSIAFGTTGQITLVGNGATIVDFSDMTNFTYTGTPKIYSTYTGATGTRTFNIGNAPATGATSTNVFDLSIGTSGNGLVISAGTDILALIGSFNNFNLTGLSQTINNNTRFIYGDFTIPASGGTLTAGTNVLSFVGVSGTETITTNGRTLDFPVTINGAGGTFVLAGALTLGSTRAFTLTAGALNLNNLTLSAATFSSSGAVARSVAFGTTGQITLGGNSATIVDFTNMTNFTYTGTPKIYSTYTGATGTRTFNFGGTTATGVTTTNIFNLSIGTSGNGLVIAAGTDAHALIGSYNNFDLTGFLGTLGNSTRFIYGNFTIPSTGGSLSAGTSVTSFVGSGSKTLSTGGRTLDFPVTVDGADGTFQLLSNFTIGSTRAFTHTNGILDLDGKTLTVGSYTTGVGTKTLTFNGGTIVSLGAWDNAQPANFTIETGTGVGTISMASANAKTFTGNSANYNCILDQSGAGTLTITGTNIFNRIRSSYANTTGNTSILLPNGDTTIITSLTGGSANNRLLALSASANTFRANIVISNSSIQTASFIQTNSIIFIANTFSTNGSTPWRWYLANSINNGDTFGAVFAEYSNTAPVLYYINSGSSFTVPSDWDNSNNAVHIYGAGGGSSGGRVISASGNRLGSAGGGGGGYTQVLNFTTTPGGSISYSIGAGGSAGAANSNGSAGGSTTFASIYAANGGGGSTITNTASTPGVAGTGATANGGIGGTGGGAASATDNSSGGGGGGSGGPNGVGGTGGRGMVDADPFGTPPEGTPGGGGGGSGGGTAGANASGGIAGTGGNNFFGRLAGGIGGNVQFEQRGIPSGRERGRASSDILNSTGGSGGGGGGGAYSPSLTDPFSIGGGAGGSGVTDADRNNPGTAGQSGGIIIVYYPIAVVGGNFSNMFLLF